MQARPFAACGPDDIPNHVLQLLLPHLLPLLVPLYRASLALGHVPRPWRDTSCVVLRKPKKPDYRDPKAYRLIAFERCIAKGLERIVAAQLSHLAKSFSLNQAADSHINLSRAQVTTSCRTHLSVRPAFKRVSSMLAVVEVVAGAAQAETCSRKVTRMLDRWRGMCCKRGGRSKGGRTGDGEAATASG
jgi:hypothetical protein